MNEVAESTASDALAQQVRKEAAELAAALEATEDKEEQTRIFFSTIRESCIPYLPCRLRDRPGELYDRCYEALFTIGRANLPLAVGFLMHQYNLAGLATLPVPSAPEFENRRKIMVDSVEKYKSLLAITSFGSNIRGRGTPNPNVMIEETEIGDFTCNGHKGFLSMAANADLLLYSGYIDADTMGMFYCNLKNQKGISFGDSLFPGQMTQADTRPVFFDNVVVKRRQVLSLEEWLTYHVSNYCTAWFEALVSSAYLGAASKAVDEVRKFGHSVSHDQQTLLAELDGFVLECGRLSLKFRSALGLAQSFGRAADKYCRAVVEDAPDEVQYGLSCDVMDLSGCIKYTCTRVAQDTVNEARRLIGTRSMTPKHPLYALSEQINFGQLHPIIPARAERDEGEEMLEKESYTGLFTWAYA